MSELRELYHLITDWTLALAENDWAVGLLALIAFSESVIFPVPPDPMLMAVGIANPPSAIWVAALVTAASVCGAYVGHLLGKRVGRPLLYKIAPKDKVARAETLFVRYGAWAVLVAAFTPIPYKVFTVLAGILNLPIRSFLLASLIGRGARFLIIGVLIYAFGESIREFIEGEFEIIAIAAGIGTIALAAGIIAYAKLRGRGRGRQAGGGVPETDAAGD